jgi:hypothetical protein
MISRMQYERPPPVPSPTLRVGEGGLGAQDNAGGLYCVLSTNRTRYSPSPAKRGRVREGADEGTNGLTLVNPRWSASLKRQRLYETNAGANGPPLIGTVA